MTDAELRLALSEAASVLQKATARRDALIREAADRGWSLRQIGAFVGMSHGGVARVLKR